MDGLYLLSTLMALGIVYLASTGEFSIPSAATLTKWDGIQSIKAVGINQKRQVVNTTCLISINTNEGYPLGRLASVYGLY